MLHGKFALGWEADMLLLKLRSYRGRRCGWFVASLAASLMGGLAGCGGGGGGGGGAGATSDPGTPAVTTYSIGGAVSGLSAGTTATITSGTTSSTANADGSFTLGRNFTAGTAYAITATATADKRCTVSNAIGTVVAANVSNVAVDCGLGVNWVTDGNVSSSALSADGRTLYIGGAFSRVGPTTGRFVRVDAPSGRVLAAPAPVRGYVIGAQADGSGGAYLSVKDAQSRSFESSSLAYSMLRIDALGRTTPFAAAVTGAVNFALVGNTLFAAARVTPAGASTPQGIAALDATTGALLNWRTALAPDVSQMVVFGNTLLVARAVTGSSGVLRTSLAAVDVTTGAVRDWAPVFTNDGSPTFDLQLAVGGNTLVVAGTFREVDGKERRGLAAFDLATLALLDWDPAASSSTTAVSVRRIAATADTVYALGFFDRIGGAARKQLAALSLATGRALDWQAPEVVRSDFTVLGPMALHQGNLIVGASVVTVGGQRRAGAFAVSGTTGQLQPLGANDDLPTPSLIVSSQQQLWWGGYFALAGGVQRRNLAAIDTRTGQATDWTLTQLQVDGVNQLMTLGNRLILRGSLQTLAGETRRGGLAAVDLTSGQVLNWDPQFTGSEGVVQLLVQGSSLYAAGNFRAWAGQPRRGIARFDTATLTLQDWAPQTPDGFEPRAIAANADKVFAAVAGDQGLMAFDATTGSRLLAWAPRFTGISGPPVIDAMVALDNTVYVVGSNIIAPDLNAIGTSAKVDATTGAAATWGEVLSSAGPVRRVFVLDGRLLGARCQFDIYGVTRCALLELSKDRGSTVAQLLGGLDQAPDSVSSDALSIYVGGRFGSNGLVPQSLTFLSR